MLTRQVGVSPEVESTGTRPRILLVEDEDALRNSLARALGQTFDVTTASDGAAAAELLVKHAYDSVLSDIGLPGMSGIDLLRLVRTYDLDVPVVLMTGAPSIDTAIAALDLGALTYIEKPVTHEDLRKTLHRAVTLSRVARTKRAAFEAGFGGSPLGDLAGLTKSLDRALDQMSLAFQPIVDRRGKKTMAFEALLRTAEPSLPDPRSVLEGAERLGRLHEVGRRVRELASASFQPVTDDTLLFVNLHPTDLLDENLYDRSAPLTKIADRVILEITERAALDHIAETKRHAARLRRLGFKLAIDDLGAGYAGLTSFATFEPEVVKLDMTLIRGIEVSTIKRHVVSSMTKLCHDLDMRVVAEGIETMRELATVIDLGCDSLQGFFLGRPARELVASPHVW